MHTSSRTLVARRRSESHAIRIRRARGGEAEAAARHRAGPKEGGGRRGGSGARQRRGWSPSAAARPGPPSFPSCVWTFLDNAQHFRRIAPCRCAPAPSCAAEKNFLLRFLNFLLAMRRSPSNGQIATILLQLCAVFFPLSNTFRNLHAGLWKPIVALHLCVHVHIILSNSFSPPLTHSLSLSTDKRTDAHTYERSTAYLIIISSRIDTDNVEFDGMETHTRKPTQPHTNPPPPFPHTRTPRSKDRTFHTLIPQFCAFCGQPITTYSEVCTPMHCHVNIYTNHESCHTHECASHIY